MASRNGEITLRDLISWEPHLRVLTPGRAMSNEDPLDRDVDWVVTIRSGQPMLPSLRGGELVLMPHRIVIDSGVPLQMLIAELGNQPVAGIVIDHPSMGSRNGYMKQSRPTMLATISTTMDAARPCPVLTSRWAGCGSTGRSTFTVAAPCAW